MGYVQTNNTVLAETTEASIGVLPVTPQWQVADRTEIGAFGAEITTTILRPVGLSRGRSKGVPTDQDSSVEYTNNLTIGGLERLAEMFFFAEYANLEFKLRSGGGTAPPVPTAGAYTIDSASALLAGKMQAVAGVVTLVYGLGYNNAENNGVKDLVADVTPGATTVVVAGLVDEPSPPANADLQVAGFRTTDVVLTVNADGTGTLVSAAAVTWDTLGVFPGMYLHVGGTDDNKVLANAPTVGAVDTWGTIRVTSTSGLTLNFDKADPVTMAPNVGTSPGGETIDILYGRWARDVPTTADSDDDRYLERTKQFEIAYPNLGTAGATNYEYANGNFGDTLTMSFPLTDVATLVAGFIGTASDPIGATRKPEAENAIAPLRTKGFATASSLKSITTDVVSSFSDVCFKSIDVNMLNNVSPEKCLGTFGATFVNAGLFEFDFDGQMAFTSPDIVNAVRDNRTVTFAVVARNEDGMIAVDIPELTLSGGDREFPLDETVLVNLTGNSFTSDQFGFNASMTLFPVVPLSAA